MAAGVCVMTADAVFGQDPDGLVVLATENVDAAQEKLARKTGGPVEIALKKGQGGKMILHFSSLDHLDELSQLFSLASESEELLEG